MAVNKDVLWEKFLERHRDMIHYLTIVSTSDFQEMHNVLLSFGPERTLGLVVSLATALEGTMKYIAYLEGNSYEEQLQTLALRVENYSRDDIEKMMEGMGDGED